MKTNWHTVVVFACIFLCLLIGVGALSVGVIDLKAGTPHQTKATLVGTYTTTVHTGKSQARVYYADVLLENKIVRIEVFGDNYERLSQMSSTCGSLEFMTQYKIGYFSKKPIGARIFLNSNEQFRNSKCLDL